MDCFKIGVEYQRNNEPVKAAEVFHALCLEGQNYSCAQMGYSSHEDAGPLKHHPEEFEFYDNRCKAQHGGACFMLSRLYLFGTGVEKDKGKFLSFLSQSCDYQHAIGCALASEQFITEATIAHLERKPKSEVKALYDKSLAYALSSCDLGHADGCRLMEKLNTDNEFKKLFE